MKGPNPAYDEGSVEAETAARVLPQKLPPANIIYNQKDLYYYFSCGGR